MMVGARRNRHSKLAAAGPVCSSARSSTTLTMRAAAATSPSPGYGKIVPIVLALASLALFLAAVLQIDCNVGFAPPGDGILRGRVLGYVEDVHAAEGQVLQVDLAAGGPGSRPILVTARDDRPWRTFSTGEEVRLLQRVTVGPRGYPVAEYIVEDFGAMWGGLLARAGAAVLCDVAAIGILIVGRRRPSAATRFPPPLPRPPAR